MYLLCYGYLSIVVYIILKKTLSTPQNVLFG